MLSTKDVAIVYETLLATPGMNDVVKISLHLPRKQILLLSKIIDVGIDSWEDGKGGILSSIDQQTLESIQGISGELLKKSGLTELNEKISSLMTK
ncbi:hypothetical protein ACDQ55_21220 [Chitinophaga sp. 30R24]|uniref:hypothetical protein n=1 Tax=Chitinophaga sp. 30R24 TaxID=3248838 RepID=UPI003B8FB119